MTILVTGGTGFIGSHLLARLSEGNRRVRAMRRPAGSRRYPVVNRGIEWIDGDMRDVEALRQAVVGVETVVHLAAATTGDWHTFREVTVEGTRRLLQVSAMAGVSRFVHVSSIGVHDLRRVPVGGFVDEETPLDGRPEARANYARSKIESERIVRSFAEHAALSVCIVRPAIVYGPQRTFSAGVGIQIGALGVVVLGRGAQVVPLVHVDDAVDGLLLALRAQTANCQSYNLVDPCSPTQNRYLELWCKLTGRGRFVVRAPLLYGYAVARGADVAGRALRPGTPSHIGYRVERLTRFVFYSSQRARRELGWRVRTPFGAGLVEATAAPV